MDAAAVNTTAAAVAASDAVDIPFLVFFFVFVIYVLFVHVVNINVCSPKWTYIWHSSVYMRAHPINLHANKQCSLRCLAFNFSLSLKSFWLHNSMLVFISFPPSAVTTTQLPVYICVLLSLHKRVHTYRFCWRRFSLIHDFQSIKRKVLCCALLLRFYLKPMLQWDATSIWNIWCDAWIFYISIHVTSIG